MGFNALTLARPVFPIGTQMREKIAAAAIREACPSTSRQSPTEAPSRNMRQCTRTCASVYRWLRMCARSR